MTILKQNAMFENTLPTTASTGDASLDIAAGNISGATSINKFGGGFESAANTKSDIWDNGANNAVYDFPTTATITHARAAVDSATTQGMVVQVQGLDANWDLVLQEVTLDATTSTVEVALTTALIRVFRMKVHDNLVADQDIWVGATGMAVGTVNGVIQAGNNQTLMAIYTVPAGYTAYMANYYCTVGNELAANKTPATTTVGLWAADRASGYEFQLKHVLSINAGQSSGQHDFSPYTKFTEKTDIKLTSTCITEPGYIHGGFDLVLIAN